MTLLSTQPQQLIANADLKSKSSFYDCLITENASFVKEYLHFYKESLLIESRIKNCNHELFFHFDTCFLVHIFSLVDIKQH